MVTGPAPHWGSKGFLVDVAAVLVFSSADVEAEHAAASDEDLVWFSLLPEGVLVEAVTPPPEGAF